MRKDISWELKKKNWHRQPGHIIRYFVVSCSLSGKWKKTLNALTGLCGAYEWFYFPVRGFNIQRQKLETLIVILKVSRQQAIELYLTQTFLFICFPVLSSFSMLFWENFSSECHPGCPVFLGFHCSTLSAAALQQRSALKGEGLFEMSC